LSANLLFLNEKEIGRWPLFPFSAGRKEVIEQVAGIVKAGDVIAVMGARDDTLSEFAQAIAEAIK